MGVIKKMDGLFLLDRVKLDKKYNRGCVGASELGGWILEGSCRKFKKIGVRVWIELTKKKKKKKRRKRELSGYTSF
jgi:hypothetical protein